MSIEKQMEGLSQDLKNHAALLEKTSGANGEQIQQIKGILDSNLSGKDMLDAIMKLPFMADSGQSNDAGSAAGGGDDAARESGAGDSDKNENNSGNSANSGESGESGGGLVRPKEEPAEMPEMNPEEFLDFITEKLGLLKGTVGGLALDVEVTTLLQKYSRSVGHQYLSDLSQEQIDAIAKPLWLDFAACLRDKDPDNSFSNLRKVPAIVALKE